MWNRDWNSFNKQNNIITNEWKIHVTNYTNKLVYNSLQMTSVDLLKCVSVL